MQQLKAKRKKRNDTQISETKTSKQIQQLIDI